MKFQVVDEDYLETFIPDFMTAEEMIDHVKKHESRFMNYFEAVIRNDGKVALAVPSHEIACMKLATQEEIDEIPTDCSPSLFIAEMKQIILCWYDFVRVPDPKRLSKESIDTLAKLENAGLLQVNTVINNREYSNYLYREALKKVEVEK